MTVLLLLGSALAQDAPALDAQLLRPSLDGRTLTYVDDAEVGDQGPSVGLVASLASDPLVLVGDHGQAEGGLERLQQEELTAAWTLDRLRVGVGLPYTSTVGPAGGGAGLGDVTSELKLQPLRGQLVSAALSARVGLPTATAEGPVGAVRSTWEVEAAVDAHPGQTLVAFNVGAAGLPEVDLGDGAWGDRLFARVGLSQGLVPDRFGLSAEVASHLTAGAAHLPGGRAAESLGGAWLAFGDFTLRATAGMGLTQAAGVPAWRAAAGVGWAPGSTERAPQLYTMTIDEPEQKRGKPGRDTDRDGVSDDQDACAGALEDLDGWEDHDGCPEGTPVELAFYGRNGRLDHVSVVIPGATVSPDGTTVLEPGEHVVEARAHGHERLLTAIQVPDGGPFTAELDLVDFGRRELRVRVRDEDGRPVRATINFLGTETFASDITADDLPEHVHLRIEVPGATIIEEDLVLEIGETKLFSILVRPTDDGGFVAMVD